MSEHLEVVRRAASRRRVAVLEYRRAVVEAKLAGVSQRRIAGAAGVSQQVIQKMGESKKGGQ